MDIYRAWTLGCWTDAVAPVIIVGEAAAGPAEHGYADRPQIVDSLFAISINICDLRIPADPQSPVNARTQVFGEMAVQLRSDRSEFSSRLDFNALIQR